MYNTAAQHLTLDLWFDKEVEPVVDQICQYVSERFTVVAKVGHEFEPQGRTIVYILSESHFAVHTYPEHKYITMDIYICNPKMNMEEVLVELLNLSKPIDFEHDIMQRGINE